MRPMTLEQVARATGGRLCGSRHGGEASSEELAAMAAPTQIDTVATDTRALDAGDGRAVLFVALKGENFDGHDHVAAAASAGTIAAALVMREVDAPIAQIIVADTERALADWATALQNARDGKVIAITGSNGKTSVKALLLSIMQRVGRAYATPGNRNNEIGLPLAVIDAPDDSQFVIYEMGAGKPGDIAYLAAIVHPDIAVVNNVAPAHLERMGSLLGIADTKAAIYDALPVEGVAVINADDAFAPYFAERAHGRRLIRFGLEASADVGASDIVVDSDGSRFVLRTPSGEIPVVLAMPGRHNIANALAAASLALGAGASLEAIRDGLQAARAVAGRLVSHVLASGATLIDDSYNANPGSLHAAIDTLATDAGESWLVLGDMRELGDDAQALHAQAGRHAKSAGIARLYAIGPLSAHAADAFGADGRQFDSHCALASALRTDLRATTAVRILVKGSRGSAMDRIVMALLEDESGAHSQTEDASHAA